MADQNPCDICGNQAEYELVPPRVTWHCPRCGAFCYDNSEGPPRIRSPDEMVRLSGWVQEQNAAHIVPVRITPEIAARVTHMQLPGLRDRALRLLSVVADALQPKFDTWFSPDMEAHQVGLQGVSYSKDPQELLVLFKILIEEGLLGGTIGNSCLTVKGLLVVEALGASKSNSLRGFVAMWFDEGLRDAWTNGFDPGIRAAGYHPFRIDNKVYVGGVISRQGSRSGSG
jgi:hypothetical protein